MRVCKEEDVPPLEGRRVEVEGHYVGVFNTEEGFLACYDVCPHRGGPLSDGDVANTTVTCPLHGRRIELKTGEVTNDEELSRTFVFPVKLEAGSVYVDARASAALGAESPA